MIRFSKSIKDIFFPHIHDTWPRNRTFKFNPEEIAFEDLEKMSYNNGIIIVETDDIENEYSKPFPVVMVTEIDRNCNLSRTYEQVVKERMTRKKQETVFMFDENEIV